MTGWTTSARFRSFLLVSTLCLSLFGCRSSVPAPISASAASSRTHISASPDAQQSAIAHVQSLPLYKEAEAAAQQKHYTEAAGLLERLAATPGLNALEIAFCHEQRDVCLEDGGVAVSRPAVRPSGSVGKGRKEAQKGDEDKLLAASAGSADCGPRALQIVCEKLGIRAEVETLGQKAAMTQQGTSFAGLSAACAAVGLKAEGVQLSREALSEAQMPALAWIQGSNLGHSGENHFIAVLSLHGSGEKGTATIHDPNQTQEETISQERLLRLSGGYLLLIRR